MAKATRKNNTKAQTTIDAEDQPNASTEHVPMDGATKIRLGVGIFLLILGCFMTLSIIGYCLSWKQDQDLLISSNSVWNFLFNTTAPIANFCGRLGAAVAHGLVYNAFGLPSILMAILITGFGYNVINKRYIFPVKKWGLIVAMGVLFLSPLLAYTTPKLNFPFGGMVGNSIIEWTSGFSGNAGVILMGILMFTFFYFVVFQFSFKPIASFFAKLNTPKGKTAVATTNITAEETTEEFKGFSNPEPSEEEQSAIIEQAQENGYMFYGNKLKETSDELELDEHDLELLKILEEEENGSLDFVLNEPITKPKSPIKEEAEFIINVPEPTPTTPKLVLGETFDTLEITNGTALDDEPIVETSKFEGEGIALEIPIATPEPEMLSSLHIEGDFEQLPYDTEEEIEEQDDVDFVFNEGVQEKEAGRHGSHIGLSTPYDPSLELPNFQFPPLDLLAEIDQTTISVDRQELENNKNQIVNTLRSFGIEIQRISATVGPTVTLYEIVPAEGVRISKIRNLEDDIALNLAALGIRIIAPIPGRGTIGIEVPNTNKQIVSMRSLLASEKFANTTMSLPIALGKKIDNENYIVDLATMPHLLMAGATGQGKSVGINAILVSLLYKKHPSQLKFVMVDPKKVELSVYRLIEKHYLAMLPNEEEPIITDTKKVVNTLNALCIEMDNRYELLKDAGARNIKEYNEKFIKRRLNPNNGHKYLPFIVLVIDEFADLIMTAGKEVEMPIARLAQLARAIGIHIIIATQRPSVNVITGIIKANFPARIAFKVSAKVDSRTILDASGADQLIGRGDMLVSHGSELLRLQCAFVDTPEVERIVEFIGDQKGYPTAFQLPEYEGQENEGIDKEMIDLSKRDKMFEDAARLVVSSQSGSTSMLQRKFNLGYNRAGRIMDQLEAANIVGPAHGSKPREVLISTEYELENLLEELF